MAKLSAREVDAVVTTVIKEIREFHKNSPEQLEYETKLKFYESLKDELREAGKNVMIDLMKLYQEKYPGLEFEIDSYYNRLEVEKPNSPSFSVNSNDIERELIVANISGDIQETMDKLVTKYTK